MKEAILNFFRRLFDMFFNAVSKPSELKKPQEIDLQFRNYQALLVAMAEIGTKEIAGAGNNEKVVKYHAYATQSNETGLNDSVPWCSSFMCWVMENTVVKGVTIGSTNSMAARSWLNWGRSTRKNPLPGDVVVYWRGARDGWKGHVGFYLGERGDHIYTLGGNQRDAVNVATYNKVKLLDIRRSSKHVKLNEAQEDYLYDLADKILRENGVRPEGSVS